MWTRSHAVTTKEVSKEQIWKLFSEVNTWHLWDKGIVYAKLDGKFEVGNTITLKPNDGPVVKIKITEVVENKKFSDYAIFPGAKMYDEHVFEETPDGLKITITISVKGVLSFIWVKLVAKNLVDNLPGDILEQIKYASKLKI